MHLMGSEGLQKVTSSLGNISGMPLDAGVRMGTTMTAVAAVVFFKLEAYPVFFTRDR